MEEEKPDWLAEVEEKPGSQVSEGSSSADGEDEGKEGQAKTSSFTSKKKPKEVISYREETEDTLTDRKKERLRKRAMNVSIYQVGQRSTPSMKTRERLIERGLPDFIIDETIDKLIGMRLLDDEDYARSFIRTKRANQRRGDYRIGLELRRIGFEDYLIEELLKEEPEHGTLSEEDRAYDLARSRIKRTRGIDRQKRLNRLVGVLSRNGFADGVFKIAQEILNEDEELENED